MHPYDQLMANRLAEYFGVGRNPVTNTITGIPAFNAMAGQQVQQPSGPGIPPLLPYLTPMTPENESMIRDYSPIPGYLGIQGRDIGRYAAGAPGYFANQTSFGQGGPLQPAPRGVGVEGTPQPGGPGRAMGPTGVGSAGLTLQDILGYGKDLLSGAAQEPGQILGMGERISQIPAALKEALQPWFWGGPPLESQPTPPIERMPSVQGGGSSTAAPEGAGAGGAGGAGGGRYTMKGTPFPSEAPRVEAPQYDIGKMFDPILAQLPLPEKISGPSKVAGLAQILGGAAAGAQRGLDTRFGGYASTGSVISGAGAGAAGALGELRHEEQALEVEYQRSLQQVNTARAGVLAQKAGAEMDLARSVADAHNKQSELEYNNKVQRALFAESKVQALGDGRLLAYQSDPETGNMTMQVIDTYSPTERAEQSMMRRMLLEKKLGIGQQKKQSEKIILDGKQYDRDALLGYGDQQTDLEAMAKFTALRILNNPGMLGKYQQDLEQNYLPNASDAENTRFKVEPQHMLFDFIFQRMLREPGERAAVLGQITTGEVPEALGE